jgi:hypothetical protein
MPDAVQPAVEEPQQVQAPDAAAAEGGKRPAEAAVAQQGAAVQPEEAAALDDAACSRETPFKEGKPEDGVTDAAQPDEAEARTATFNVTPPSARLIQMSASSHEHCYATNPVRTCRQHLRDDLVEQVPPTEAMVTASAAETNQVPVAAEEETRVESSVSAPDHNASQEDATVAPAPDQVQVHCIPTGATSSALQLFACRTWYGSAPSA